MNLQPLLRNSLLVPLNENKHTCDIPPLLIAVDLLLSSHSTNSFRCILYRVHIHVQTHTPTNELALRAFDGTLPSVHALTLSLTRKFFRKQTCLPGSNLRGSLSLSVTFFLLLPPSLIDPSFLLTCLDHKQLRTPSGSPI